MQLRVVGPAADHPLPADFRRLFPGERLTAARRRHLLGSSRIVALSGARIVGLAAYDQTPTELRVHELGIDPGAPVDTRAVAAALLDGLELACLAAGGEKVLLLPRAARLGLVFVRRGYVTVGEGCAGGWLEKSLR